MSKVAEVTISCWPGQPRPPPPHGISRSSLRYYFKMATFTAFRPLLPVGCSKYPVPSTSCAAPRGQSCSRSQPLAADRSVRPQGRGRPQTMRLYAVSQEQAEAPGLCSLPLKGLRVQAEYALLS